MSQNLLSHKQHLLRSTARWGGGALALAAIAKAAANPFQAMPGAVSVMAGSAAFVLALFALVQLVRALWALLTASPEEQRAIAAAKPLPYRHFYGGSGLALDPQKREVHLYANSRYRVYPYSSVRGWERNHVEAGAVVNGGLQGAALNMQQGLAARKASGFFVTVKDVDHPRWHIRFSKPQIKRELPRWMEIFEQQINES